jgi:hypothetical protein
VAEDEKAVHVAEEGVLGEDPELFAATPAPAKKNKNAESVVSPRPPSSRARRRASARVSTPARGERTPAAVSADAPTDAVAEPVVDLTSPDGARAVAAALVARRRAGPERARALELAAAARGKRRREDRDVSSRDVRVSEKDRDRRTAGDNSDATETTAPSSPEMEFSRAARRAACAFLKAVADAHASGPPCSLPGMELFCVTSTSRLREAVQAAPRLVLEQQMAHPQPFLKCGCCPPGGGASATLPDCCAAYTLLQDAGDAANVHEWFRAFCEMHAGFLGTKAKKIAKRRGEETVVARGGARLRRRRRTSFATTTTTRRRGRRRAEAKRQGDVFAGEAETVGTPGAVHARRRRAGVPGRREAGQAPQGGVHAEDGVPAGPAAGGRRPVGGSSASAKCDETSRVMRKMKPIAR